jgi:cell wall-associated NlpC family hydrolase
MDAILSQKVADEAVTWEGTPYHHKGRVKNVGVDCGGFIYCVYAQFLNLKPFPDYYAEDWALHGGSEEIYLDFIGDYVVQSMRPVVGGLVLFQYGRRFAHGAIYLPNDRYIHAWGRTGFGCVQISRRGFFSTNDGRPRAAKFFDVVI